MKNVRSDKKLKSTSKFISLIPKGRLYVHLSSDIETAKKVGSRHGRPVIYEIDCRKMAGEGYVFYLSENGVWLTKAVPIKYLHKVGK